MFFPIVECGDGATPFPCPLICAALPSMGIAWAARPLRVAMRVGPGGVNAPGTGSSAGMNLPGFSFSPMKHG